MHLTVAMLNGYDFFQKFGKAGTTNDIAVRNHSSSEGVITYVAPVSDKLQPLLQCMAMCDLPVVVIDEMTKQAGEILLLLHEKRFGHGLIVTAIGDVVKDAVKDLSVAGFDFVEKDEMKLRQKILEYRPAVHDKPAIVPIDNYFTVKGVGTVVLGLVKSGTVKQYDDLVVYPINKQVTVKSIQAQDNDVKESQPLQRVGLALKGVDAGELRRGYVVSSQQLRCVRELEIDFVKNKYSKFEVAPGKKIMVGIGLQVVQGEVVSVQNTVKLMLDSDVVVHEDRALLLSPDSLPRIVGSGTIL